MPPTRKRQRSRRVWHQLQLAPSRIRGTPSILCTWLDRLPLEVSERIAQHACKGRQNVTARHLAQVSPSQRRAVLNVLGRRLLIPDSAGKRLAAESKEWIDIFGNDLVEVVLEDFGDFEPAPLTLPLLSLPKVRIVWINDYPKHLAGVARSKSITEVSIFVEGRTPVVLLFKALSKVKLGKLYLSCDAKATNNVPCTFHDEKAFPPYANTNAIATWCPHLKSLSVDCFCSSNVVHSIWKVLPTLKALREMTVSMSLTRHRIPDDSVNFLSTLDSVKLHFIEHALLLAPRIGAALTEFNMGLGTPGALLSGARLATLVQFPRLQVIVCEVEEDAEVVLPSLMQMLPALRRLDLLWHHTKPRQRRRQQSKYYQGTKYLYATAAPGILLRAVERGQNLSELRLARIRIGVTELMAILISVGPRLRCFSTSLADQDENPFDRLDALMYAAATFNPELRGFYLVDGSPKYSPQCQTERQILRERGRELLLSLGWLERRAPFLVIASLSSFITDMTRE